jgi:hypothetical protein
VVFLSPFRQMPGWYLNLDDYYFLPHPSSSSFTHHPFNCHYIAGVTTTWLAHVSGVACASTVKVLEQNVNKVFNFFNIIFINNLIFIFV